MRFEIRHFVLIPYLLASMTGCSAAIEPSGPEGSKGERTGKTSEALNPNCSSPTLAFLGWDSNHNIGTYWGVCFNGGDTVVVYLVDDTIGQILGEVNKTAGPDGDSNTWFPGAISGNLFFPTLAVPATFQASDHLRLVALDTIFWIAQTSCFTLNSSTCN
jgi:hypothetical protein